jgi:hypothetical protein
VIITKLKSITVTLFQKGYYFEETMAMAKSLHEELLAKPHLHNEVIMDDRCQLTIGKRLNIIRLYGITYTIALGKGVSTQRNYYVLNIISVDIELFATSMSNTEPHYLHG